MSNLEFQQSILTVKFSDLIDLNTNNLLKSQEESLDNKKFDIIQIENLHKNLSPEIFHTLKNYLNDSGCLILLFCDNFKNEDNSMLKNVSNMKFAGYIETKIETVGNNFKILGKKRKVKTDKKIENPWKNINLEVKSDLILEDELVDPFDTYQKFSKKIDCVTKPKPCKNCNCGRAGKDANQDDVTNQISSSCGRCYLGDAFRCAGCPYKGKPAFEPGDKIDFSNVNGTSVNANEQIEVEIVNVKFDNTNKIKIDI